MDEAKQFLAGLMKALQDRLGNPFVGAFVIAWTIWNFRLVLVLVGSSDAGGWQAKIQYIDTKLMVSWRDWAIHGYLVPAIGALLWIFVLPPVLARIAAKHERNRSFQKSLVYNATSERVLSIEEAAALRQHVIEQRGKLLNERERRTKALEDLVMENNEQLSRISALSSEVRNQAMELERLKAPPPQPPILFNKLSVTEAAKALGLELADSRRTTHWSCALGPAAACR